MSCGAPKPLLPPEVWLALEGYYGSVDGASVDMWCYGVLAFNAFTGFSMCDKLKELKCWKRDIYPILFEDMQIFQFHELLTESAFPGTYISLSEVKMALNFLHTILKVRPEQRPTAKEALNHAFFTGTEVLEMPDTDTVWTEKGFSYDMLSPDPPVTEDKTNLKALDSLKENLSRTSSPLDVPCNCSISSKPSHQSYGSAEGFFTPDRIHPSEMAVIDKSLTKESVMSKHLVDDRNTLSKEQFSFNSGDALPCKLAESLSTSERMDKNSIAYVSNPIIPHMRNIPQESSSCGVGDGQSSKSGEFSQNISMDEDIEINSMSDLFNIKNSHVEPMPNEHQRTLMEPCERHTQNSTRETKLLVEDSPPNVTNATTAVCDNIDDAKTETSREEISEHPGSSDTIQVPRDAAPKRKSRRKRVQQWFQNVWTRFCTCGSGAAHN